MIPPNSKTFDFRNFWSFAIYLIWSHLVLKLCNFATLNGKNLNRSINQISPSRKQNLAQKFSRFIHKFRFDDSFSAIYTHAIDEFILATPTISFTKSKHSLMDKINNQKTILFKCGIEITVLIEVGRVLPKHYLNKKNLVLYRKSIR